MSATGSSKVVSCSNCGAKNRIDPARSGAEAVCGRCKKPLSGQNTPVILTDQNFAAETTNTDLPVLVDLWAAWCGPCRMIAPIIESLAVELSGRAKICKLDVDANKVTAARFGVQSIPTLLILKSGREVDRLVGSQPKEAILRRLTQFI
jgi:thioredoxin 2